MSGQQFNKLSNTINHYLHHRHCTPVHQEQHHSYCYTQNLHPAVPVVHWLVKWQTLGELLANSEATTMIIWMGQKFPGAGELPKNRPHQTENFHHHS